MKDTEKEMTLRAAIACTIAQVGGIYTLLGKPVFTIPKAPAIIKKKIVDGVKKFFESN